MMATCGYVDGALIILKAYGFVGVLVMLLLYGNEEDVLEILNVFGGCKVCLE